jgi:ATP-dependent protease ClpP protease subunit
MSSPTPLNVVPPTAYISFSAEINAHTTESLIAVLAQQANQGVSHVYLLLSTPGGVVMNGMNLYNIMRAMPFELTVHNVGNVDSIGNAIFLAGAVRYACPHSTFMFHGVGRGTQPGEILQTKSLRESLETILADEKRIASVISERTTIPIEDAQSLFLEAQTKDAAYAASYGIVDEVRDVQIPAGSPIISLVFQR